MKIFDCFPFFNELEIAEIRIKELYEHVDYFVIAESERTHSGLKKPLYFQENQSRFDQFKDKIIRITVNLPSAGTEEFDANWHRERTQRDGISKILNSLGKEDDIVITTDADEIINPKRLEELKEILKPDEICCLEMQCSWYYLNLIGRDKWYSGKAVKFSTYKKAKGLSDIRVAGSHSCLRDAGWHLGYMGGAERVKQKLISFAHQELNQPLYVDMNHIKETIGFGTCVWDKRDETQPCGVMPYWQFVKVGMNTNLPDVVVCNKMKYQSLISEAYFSEYLYDIGNLNKIRELCLSVNHLDGSVIDLGTFEGRCAINLANAIYPQNVIAVDQWKYSEPERIHVSEQCVKNINALTNGNIILKEQDVFEFLENFENRIKFIQIDVRYESDFIAKCLELIRPKMIPGGIICGYDYANDHTREAVGDAHSSGRLWWKIGP